MFVDAFMCKCDLVNGHLCIFGLHVKPLISLSHLQYSAKEDKYEEEIKVLTDKLKEVSSFSDHIVCVCAYI